MALKTMIENLNKAREAYETQLKSLGKSAQKEVANELAPLIPTGCRLQWTQYTPYFNDGEPCVFDVNDPQVCRADHEEDDERKCVDVTTFGIEHYGTSAWSEPIEGVTKAALKRINSAWKNLPKDLLEKAFGDHTRVIVYTDGKYSVDEYSHD